MKCAFYEKEITPPLGDDMPGYFSSRFAEDVEERLYVKAVVFAEGEEEKEHCAAIVVVDAVEVTPEFCKAVTDRVQAFCGIPAANIAVAANHTHYGIPDGFLSCERDNAFMEVVEKLTADCITLAYKRLQPCFLHYGIGREDTVAFNRDYVLQDGSVVSNPYGKESQIVRPYAGIDPDLPVLSVLDADGKCIGALFTYALHQDTVGMRKFSGDFSSEISIQLKKRYGAEFVSIYLAGCCGDINHCDYIGGLKSRLTKKIGRKLADEVIRVMEEGSEPVVEQTLTAGRKEIQLNCRIPSEEYIEYAKRAVEDPNKNLTGHEALPHLQLMLKYVEEHREKPYTMVQPVQVIRIGDVWFFAMPGELYHQFGEQIKAGAPGKKWLISELSNSDLGYVPISELFGTKIYPAILLGKSCIEENGGEKLVKAALELAEELHLRGVTPAEAREH